MGDESRATEVGQVALVAVADFFNQTMQAQTLEQIGAARRCEFGRMRTQVGGAKAADGPFAAGDGEEQPVVVIELEVEAAVGAVMVGGRFGDLIDGLERGIGIVDGGEEGEVALVGRVHELSQGPAILSWCRCTNGLMAGSLQLDNRTPTVPMRRVDLYPIPWHGALVERRETAAARPLFSSGYAGLGYCTFLVATGDQYEHIIR